MSYRKPNLLPFACILLFVILAGPSRPAAGVNH